MSEFQYKIEYKAGSKNVVSDQLNCPVKVVRMVGQDTFLGMTKDEFIQAQVDEPRWREMKEYLEGEQVP